MIVSYSKNFVYVHIHKTAGESIEHALAQHLNNDDLVIGVTNTQSKNKSYSEKFDLYKYYSWIIQYYMQYYVILRYKS